MFCALIWNSAFACLSFVELLNLDHFERSFTVLNFSAGLRKTRSTRDSNPDPSSLELYSLGIVRVKFDPKKILDRLLGSDSLTVICFDLLCLLLSLPSTKRAASLHG